MEAAGFEVRCQIIRAKNTFAWGFGRYEFQHEPLFYCHVVGQKDPWYGDKSQSTLWEENKPAANRLHPTTKSVELIERALANSSKAGDIVVDLFGGSGSTMIGCERRGRKARLMEIDPKYADVITNRYQEYSGKKARLEGDGRTFDEIAQERLKEVPMKGALPTRYRGASKLEILAGNPDLHGLCLALSDWSGELRLMEEELGLRTKKPAAAETGRAEGI